MYRAGGYRVFGLKLRKLTRRLKPVTLEREVAMEAPERGSSPRWPNINIGEARKRYWDTVTTIIGIAIPLTFFTSSVQILLFLHVSSSLLFSSFSFSGWRRSESSMIGLFPEYSHSPWFWLVNGDLALEEQKQKNTSVWLIFFAASMLLK